MPDGRALEKMNFPLAPIGKTDDKRQGVPVRGVTCLWGEWDIKRQSRVIASLSIKV